MREKAKRGAAKEPCSICVWPAYCKDRPWTLECTFNSPGRVRAGIPIISHGTPISPLELRGGRNLELSLLLSLFVLMRKQPMERQGH